MGSLSRLPTLILVLLVSAFFLSPAGHSAEEPTLRSAKIIAVHIYAEWCDPCQEMDEMIELLADRFDGESILWIVLDATNLSTKSHSEMLAAALGLEVVWRSQKIELAMIYLLGANTKEVIDMLKPGESFEEMSTKIRKALDR